MSIVTKNRVSDFSSNFNPSVFDLELKGSSILSGKYQSFTTYDDDIQISFSSVLDASETTELDTIVSNHDYAKDMSFQEENTYYVSTTGKDTNHGKSAFQPFKTIKKAAEVVTAKGGKNLIRLLPGTYYENNPISLPDQTSLIAIGQTPSTQIYPLNANVDMFQLSGSGSIYGLNINGVSNGGIAINYNASGGTIWRIINIVFEDCYQGVKASGNSGALFVSECICKNISTYAFSVAMGAQITLVKSKLYLISGTAIFVEDDTGRLEVEGVLMQGCNVGVDTKNIGRITDCDIIQCNTGAKVSGTGAKPSFKGMRVIACGVSIEVSGSSVKPLLGDVECRDSVVYDLLVTATSGSIIGSGNVMDDTKFNNATNLPIYQNFLNEADSDQGTSFMGQLQVGTHTSPSESIFGEGDSHTKGMKVFTYNGSIFMDITNTVKVLEGEIDIFPDTTTNSEIYIGGDYKFTGLKTETGSVAINYGSTGGIMWEYGNDGTNNTFTHIGAVLDNGQEAPFCIHVRDSDAPYLHHNAPTSGPMMRKPDPFGRANASEQIKFGLMKDWVKTTVNGTSKYWIRFKIIDAITTIPKIKKFKLGTNRLEIEEDGFLQEYGDAVGWDKLSWHLEHMKHNSLFTAPTSTPLYLSSHLVSRSDYNTFPSTVDSASYLNTIMPEDFDNSLPIVVRLRYCFDTAPVSSPKVRCKIVINYSNHGTTFSLSSSGLSSMNEETFYPQENTLDAENGVFTSLLISGNELEESEMVFVLPLSKLRVTRCMNNIVPDKLWLTLIREGTHGNDTYTGNIIFHSLHATYPSGSSGVHRMSLPMVGLY